MWRSEYTKEVWDYIFDSYPYTHTVWQTIKSLRQTPNGLPPQGWTQLEPEVFLWQVEEHDVLYERHQEDRKLMIFVLKPSASEEFDA
ncbi:MAG: hypothetical protein U0350_25955 [Caldilineaceae bacterium]